MPTITPKRTRRATPVVEMLEDDAPKQPQLRKPAKRDVPVGKIVTSTITDKVANTFAKSTSMGMLNAVGADVAISGREAYNIYHPALKMLSRRLPDVALTTNLSKPDADDLELIIVTAIEYIVRIIDNWSTRMYNRAVGKQITPQNIPVPTQRVMPPSQLVQREIEPELEEFIPESGEEPELAPMKNGNGSISELIERGYIPRDMGENIA